MSTLTSIHINKYLVEHECLYFLFEYSYIFLNPGISELFKRISPTNLFVFIGLRTLKPTRTRTLNRIPIWHCLIYRSLGDNLDTHDIFSVS